MIHNIYANLAFLSNVLLWYVSACNKGINFVSCHQQDLLSGVSVCIPSMWGSFVPFPDVMDVDVWSCISWSTVCSAFYFSGFSLVHYSNQKETFCLQQTFLVNPFVLSWYWLLIIVNSGVLQYVTGSQTGLRILRAYRSAWNFESYLSARN